MFDYILFDLDGTLTDPKLGITRSVQYALRALGIEEPSLDKLEPFIGLSGGTCIQHRGPGILRSGGEAGRDGGRQVPRAVFRPGDLRE